LKATVDYWGILDTTGDYTESFWRLLGHLSLGAESILSPKATAKGDITTEN